MRLVEPEIPNARSVADALAASAAGYVLIAPSQYRDAATASVALGFQDACLAHGIPIDAGDLAYYVKIIPPCLHWLRPFPGPLINPAA
jgi:hypothetical protein